MPSNISDRAFVSKNAELGENVTVGPFAVIEDGTFIGNNVEIGSGALIASGTTVGDGCRIFHGASVGTDPQDLKYKGEETTLVIGRNTIIREFCTLNRGTTANGTTNIGDNCALLAYCHVAHDCKLGNNVVISNSLSMAGHVTVGNNVVIGGDTAIHQFCRIGDYCMVGARNFVVKDIVPFALFGDDKIVGINKVGLERRGFDEVKRREIKRAYKSIFRSSDPIAVAVEKIKATGELSNEVRMLVDFIDGSERGLYNMGV